MGSSRIGSKAAFNSPKANKKGPGAGPASSGAAQGAIAIPMRKAPSLAIPPSPSNSQQATSSSSSSSQFSFSPSNAAQSQVANSNQPPPSKSAYASPDSPIASVKQKQPGMAPRAQANGGGMNANAAQVASRGGNRLNVNQSAQQQANLKGGMQQQRQGALFSPAYAEDGESKNGDMNSNNVRGIVPQVNQGKVICSYAPPCLRSVRRALMNNTLRNGGQVDPAEAEELQNYDIGDEEEEFDPFIFIKHLPPLSSVARNRKSPIPPKPKEAPMITLALDLDETLVHCSVQPIDNAELTFNVNFNGMDYEVYVRTRPHLEHFLRTVSQWFEIIIFTASQKVYADKLLNILDPKNEYIQHRVFRDSCVNVDGNYLKDLHILGREIPKVAIVDNSMQAFGFQVDNGIPIESWFDDDNDSELLSLIPFLRALKDSKDVRPLIRQTFRLNEFIDQL